MVGVGLSSARLSRRAVRSPSRPGSGSSPPCCSSTSSLARCRPRRGLGGGGGESGTVGVGAEGWGWCAFRCASNALKATGNLDECIVVCVGRFVYGAFLVIFLVISLPATFPFLKGWGQGKGKRQSARGRGYRQVVLHKIV